MNDRRFDGVEFTARFAPYLVLVLLVVAFAILEPRFITPFNIFNTLRQVSVVGLIAIGMTFVILTAGIDLSVGSLVALAGLAGGLVAKGGLEDRFAVGTAVDAGNPVWLAMVTAIAVGMVCGALQGGIITRLRVPPFVATLGGLSMFRGAALLLSGGGPISGFDAAYVWWGKTRLFGVVPVMVIVFLGFAALAHVVLRYTQFGRHVYAVGGNRSAAKLAGIRDERVIFLCYVIIGFCAGLAGFLLSARLNSAEAVAGQGLELDVIAAVVIGGTSLFGGIGSIARTVVGVLLIGILRNGLVLLNVSSFVQMIIIGAVLVAAVAFDQYATRRNPRA